MKKKAVAKKKDFDVIIVGGGPGGLSIGSLLAKEGVSSAILEREVTLGGRYRAVHFHGCRSDNGFRLAPTGMFASPQDTYLYKFLSYMGMPLKYKLIDWTMGLVSKDDPNRIRYLKLDRKKGMENFFEFFAFGSGAPMEEPSREALKKAFRMMGDTSEEECRKLVNVSFASWLDKYVEDPMARLVLYQTAPLIGAPATDVNFGQMAYTFGAFQQLDIGAPLFGYPKQGIFEDFAVAPLIKYYTEHGGEVFTNRTAKSIVIENGEARGVVAHNNETRFLENYTAPVVICAIPIFEAVSKNILMPEFLTKEWAECIRQCAKLAYDDLSGFYLLREDVIPREGPVWVHVFDADYGIPTYVGDLGLAAFANASEPPGKQLVQSYIPAGLEATHFGSPSRMDKVWEANRRFKEAVNKAFPAFIKSIEFEGLTLQLNFGRYAWAVQPSEIDVKSPNIRGLYFAGDSIWSVSSMSGDKVFQVAFPLCERVLDYVRSRA